VYLLASLNAVMDVSMCGSLLNKVRGWYDGKEILLTDNDAVAFHIEILVFLRGLAEGDEEMFGVGTARFVTELVREFMKAVDIKMHTVLLNCLLRLIGAMLSGSTDVWRLLDEARDDVYTELFGWFLESDKMYRKSSGRADTVVLNMLAGLIGDMPESVEKDFARVVRVLGETRNYEVQRQAYGISVGLIREIVHVESLRIEMGVEKTGVDKIGETGGCLPMFIVERIERGCKGEGCELFGYLACWKLVFCHFENATPEFKAGVVGDLLKGDAVSFFLERVFGILGVGQGVGGGRGVDLGKWDFREVEVEAYDETSVWGEKLLAAHLYWLALRLLPAAVRGWWGFLKNRGLSIAVEEFTAKCFTGLVVDWELGEVMSADKELFEGIVVKRIGSDIAANYEVEEAVLGLLLRLPSSFPLKQVEITESTNTNRAGVADARWKAWLLSVASVMMNGGAIVEAIQVFGKNVKSHFSGVEDCAICYSLIGVIDRTLPGKRCGTCKALFHGGCLFKWFRTGGSSTCPLCRSLF
jgi:hypothetical protein